MSKTDRVKELTRKILELETAIDAIKAKAKAEDRSMTDEERTEWGRLNNEYKASVEELHLEQEEQDIRSEADKASRPAVKPNPTEDEFQKKYPGMPAKEDRFANLGEFVRDVVQANPRVGGSMSRKLMALQRAATGMGESSPTDGGFFVQTDQSARLIEPLFDAQSGDAILNRINTTPISANSDGMSFNAIDETDRSTTNWGGIAMYWLGEGVEKTPTSPKLRKVELKLKKIAGLCYLTDELIKDAPALSSRLERGFQNALRSALIKAIVQGTGAGQPLGLINSTAKVTVSKETGQLAATIVTENIEKMFMALDPNATNPVWLYNRNTCFQQLHQLQIALGTAGALVNMPGGGIAVSPNSTLLGLPLIPCPWCSVLGTEGDLMLVDLPQYEFITKGGPEVAYSIHVRFIYDETAMRIVYRCDGRPAVVSATTLEDGSTSVSPIVTLETRS